MEEQLSLAEPQVPPQTSPAPPPAGRVRLQQLHTFLVKEGTDVPEEYQVFEQKLLEQPERLEQLHKYLVDDQTDVPKDYRLFEQRMTEGFDDFKKKTSPEAFGSGGPAAGPPAPTGGALAEPVIQEGFPGTTPLPGGPATVGVGDVPAEVPDGPRLAARAATQLAPGDEYLNAGLPLPPGEQLRAEQEAADQAKQQEATAAAAGDGFFGTLGKQLSNLPATLENAAGNVVDYLGDALEPAGRAGVFTTSYGVSYGEGTRTPLSPEELNAPLSENKLTDQAGRALRQDAAGRTTPVSAAAQRSVLDDPTNPAAWGNLFGQGVNSVVAVGAASLAGGPAAGIAAGAGLGISATKDAAREAGLSDREATLTATALAPIQGVLEEMGMGFITKNKAVTGLLTKTIVGQALAAGGGRLTESGLAQSVRALLPQVVKRGLAGGAGEAVTEFLQGEAEGIAKLTADQLRGNPGAPAGQGRYGTSAFDALLKNPVEQAVGGLLVGGAAGSAFHGDGHRTLPLGATPDGRPLAVELDPAGAPVRYVDDQGPVDFGPAGPPPAVQRAVAKAQAAAPAPLEPAQMLSDQKVPVLAHGRAGQLFADFDLQGQPVKLYAENGQVYALDDPAIRSLVENKWPGAAKEAKAATKKTPKPAPAPEPAAPAVEAPYGFGPPEPGLVVPRVEPEQVTTPASTDGAPAVPEISPNATETLQSVSENEPIAEVRTDSPNGSVAQQGGSLEVPSVGTAGDTAPANPDDKGGPAQGGNYTEAITPRSYGTPAENRAAGAFEKDGATYTRQPPLGERVARGSAATAEFSSGVQQPVHYAVMEAADLQPSHLGGSQNLNHFLPEAQPKNRSAAFDPASQKAIADVAAAPDLARLGEAPNAYSGAPIVNGRGEALQGNGRGAGIRAHYQQGGTSYKTDVVAAAEKVGIPAGKTAGFREPVLVRVADVSDARARELGNYTAADTESGGKRRLDPRQAAGRLGDEGRVALTRLATPQGDATLTETIRGNTPEILRLLRKQGLVNETQLQTLVKGDGEMTPEGVEDVAGLYRHQLFRDGDPNLPELFAELPSAAQGGLDRAVGALLGVPERASLVPEVQDAIGGVREFVASGTDFNTWAGQADMFRGGEAPSSRYSPLTLKLIDLLTTEKRPTYIARLLNAYAAAVKGEASSLFGETPPKTRTEAVQQTFGVADDRPRTNARNPAAAESAPGPVAADQRPPAPEPFPIPGPPAADGPGARADASANRPGGAGGPSTAEPQRGVVADAPAAPSFASLNDQLRQALASGDQAAAAEHFAQAEKLAQAQAARGPEAGRASTAFRILAENAPAAVVHAAEQEVAGQRAKAETKLAKQAVGEGKQVRQEKAVALDHALATPTVRAAREKIAGKTRPTTKEQLATVRAERASLVEELRSAAKRPGGVAYSSVVPITPAQARAAELHLKIFRTYVREGIVHVRDLVARWKRDAGPLLAGMSDAELTKLATTALVDHRDAVRRGVADLGTTLDQIARDYTTDPAAVGNTLTQRFADGAGLNPAEAQQYADAIRQEFDKRIGAARQRRLDQLNQQAIDGAKPTRADLDQIRELFALAPTDDAAILDHLRRATALPTLTPDAAAQLRTLADEVTAAPTGFQKDTAVGRLLHATAQFKALDWLEVANALWYANVLSGYKTHGVNLFANGLQTGAELLVHTAQALATGKGRYATASARGLAQGLHRGAREAASVLATGREVSRDGVKFEEPGLLEYWRFAGGAANPVNYLKFVGRALRAGDVLFSTGLKEMRAHELAVREALAEGTDGEPSVAVWARYNQKLYNTTQRLADAHTQATAEGLRGNDHARRVFEIAEQSRPVALVEEAREYGTRAVFNGDVKGGLGWATTGIQYITQGIDIAGFKPAKYVVPFTRVIANVANAALDYTPVGAARAGISLSRAQLGRGSGGHLFGGKPDSPLQRQLTGEERGHLAIKSAFGAAVAVVAYALTHNKDEEGHPTLEISGAGTGTPSKDAQLRAGGWQPYSVRAGGKWYSYASTPVGIMLSVVGNLSDGEKYRGEHLESSDEALSAVALNGFRALQFTKDLTALKGAADFLAAADSKSPDQVLRWAQRLAVSTVKGYVPWGALLTQVAKDGEQLAGQSRKQARSFGQSLVQDIPVARNGLHDALDVLGDPLPVDTDRLVSSAPPRDAPARAVWDWLEKNNLFVSVPNRNSGGAMVLRAHAGHETPMTDDEYFAFMQKRGQLLKEALHHQLPELQKLTPKQAKKKLKLVVQRVSRTAKQQVFSGPRAASQKE